LGLSAIPFNEGIFIRRLQDFHRLQISETFASLKVSRFHYPCSTVVFAGKGFNSGWLCCSTMLKKTLVFSEFFLAKFSYMKVIMFVWNQHTQFAANSTSIDSVNVIPEPSGIALLVLGAGVFAVRRTRKQDRR
jgi:hypothetical protein